MSGSIPANKDSWAQQPAGAAGRARLRILGLSALALGAAACAPAAPSITRQANPGASPKRVLSLDYCADQFLLKLADRDQILAVSPDATADYSYMRASAAGLRTVRPRAEDVLALQPDLIVRSYGGGPNAVSFFERAGVPVVQVGYADGFAGVRANIRLMAQALGHPERGEAVLADMNQRLAAIPKGSRQTTALYMTPGGVSSGSGTLVDAIFQAAGVRNFVTEPGWVSLPLESLAHTRPDLVVTATFGRSANSVDAWSAMRHPVAQRQAKGRTVAMDGAWTSCGGWFLMDAVEALSAAANDRVSQ